MAYFIIGASGSGKTACLPEFKKLLPDFVVYDFDDIGVPEGADKKWRQEATEKWVQKITCDNQDKFCLFGQMVVGEILACPSATRLNSVVIFLLDCSDIIRIRRLRKRNTYGIGQDTLNWASWLRMHCEDPQWEQRVIKNDSWSGLEFDRWDKLLSWDEVARITTIDTNNLSVAEVANILGLKIKNPNPTPPKKFD